jgi:hypothetical protein
MSIIFATRRLFTGWFAAAWLILRFAPWLLLPILLTEGLQHVAEIQLGMFASRADFIALSDDATRMAFGVAKTTGLLISVLLVARAVALGSASRAIRPRWRPMAALAVFLALTFLLDLAFKGDAARAIAPDPLLQGANILLQTLLTVPLLAALFEDEWATLRAAGWRLVPALLLPVLLAALVFLPLQILHSANHIWALGAPLPAVWALMLFDTVVVGLIALMVGSALAIGWRRFVGGVATPPIVQSPALPPAQPAAL